MSTQANTRIFKGSVLKVDDLAMSYITTGEMISTSGFGAPASEIPISTAASVIDEFRLGLPDQGDATFEFNLDMDDAFQDEMETMRDNQETRTFKLAMVEGTKKVATFSAFVIDADVKAAFNDVAKMTLVLGISSAVVWAAT